MKSVNLVLGVGEPLEQRINLLEAAQMRPGDQQGSFEGVLDGRQELSRLFGTLNYLSKVVGYGLWVSLECLFSLCENTVFSHSFDTLGFPPM